MACLIDRKICGDSHWSLWQSFVVLTRLFHRCLRSGCFDFFLRNALLPGAPLPIEVFTDRALLFIVIERSELRLNFFARRFLKNILDFDLDIFLLGLFGCDMDLWSLVRARWDVNGSRRPVCAHSCGGRVPGLCTHRASHLARVGPLGYAHSRFDCRRTLPFCVRQSFQLGPVLNFSGLRRLLKAHCLDGASGGDRACSRRDPASPDGCAWGRVLPWH